MNTFLVILAAVIVGVPVGLWLAWQFIIDTALADGDARAEA